ncbi:MAG: amidohydrolase family protein [Phycisphaerae bacterium]|nr:amidohydrolase family protein [Phycisphaerae bacterium]
MIVDCHTYIWTNPSQLGRDSRTSVLPQTSVADESRPPTWPDASIEHHRYAAGPVDKSFVLGFKSRYLDAEIPNSLIAEYVRQHPDKLVGFAGVDPVSVADALREIAHAREELGLRGIAVSPAAQDFHPTDTRAMRIFEEAARLRLPVLVHSGAHFSPSGRMAFARPHLLDDVAREFPSLKLIVAHLGSPWIDECVALLGKHANVFADISGLLQRPWSTYNALVAAFEGGVINKLLFASDFPFTSAAACIERLYSINRVTLGTSLPSIPRQHLRGIVERDSLALLGLAPPAPPRPVDDDFLDDHDT